MNPILTRGLAPSPARSDEGSTRPFVMLRVCARLGYATLALLQPDLALAASPMLALLVTQRLTQRPGPAGAAAA